MYAAISFNTARRKHFNKQNRFKHIDNLSDEDVTQLEIPTAQPWVYDLGENLNRM